MTHQAPHANSFANSLFCQRLQSLAQAKGSTTALKNLCNATERLVLHSEAISRRVNEHLPQFTLHDGTHLWNVLSFMEELAGGKKAINKLSAGDCAMAVWACFIHDLGMVIESAELANLDASERYETAYAEEWKSYRDGHEHWEAIRRDPNGEASRMKLGIIRAAFVRDTHARIDTHTGHCRIADWLDFIEDQDRVIAQALADYTFARRIVPVAVSHNQDITWLPRQLESLMARDKIHAENFGPSLGTIHWTWIGWLLRLADVFDCDASRTPRILFERIGITDRRSITEWRKHLAIPENPQWQEGKDKKTLAFTCHHCPGPDVEKAIHQIIGWMNDEIVKCHAAWLDVPESERLPLHLPSQARIDILDRQGGYLYQDIEFRLDRDAVVELLMGESLYGGPELALRELVQNALDAVHLRDQRNKLAIALEQAGNTERARQPHEAWGATTGEVHVTWGTEPDGQKRSWIKVQDNGVGMTVATMRRFLTQIGKSYYKSDDFHAEQELMRRHGILCTAISQFGIGFLSVFMLADHVEIHTRPVGATDHPDKTKPNWQETERFPFRADIHGPHGLLAFYPDDVRQTGTTMTLWLKERFVLAKWDRDLVVEKLRREFYPKPWERRPDDDRERLPINETLLDPAFEIGRFVVWPIHPVILGNRTSHLCFDDAFHFRDLAPLNSTQLYKLGLSWGEQIPEAKDAVWQCCDWTDESLSTGGATGTGTRIRIVGAQPGGASKEAALAEWLAQSDNMPSGTPRLLLGIFSEAQAPEPLMRYQCLVNGIRVLPGYVPSNDNRDYRDCKIDSIVSQMPMVPGVGGWVWIDLRGRAMPRLRADRSSPTRGQYPDWDLQPLLKRWKEHVGEDAPAWVRSLVWCPEIRSFEALSPSRLHYRLTVSGISALALSAIWRAEQVIHRGVGWTAAYKHRVIREDALAQRRLMGLALNRDMYRESYPGETVSTVAALRTLPDEAISQETLLHPELIGRLSMRDTSSDQFSSANKTLLDASRLGNLANAWIYYVETSTVSEAFWPSLKEGHPGLEKTIAQLDFAKLALTGPLHVTTSETSEYLWLACYDLVCPFTGLELPTLSKTFPFWRSNRCWRSFFTLAFLFGESPLELQNLPPGAYPFARLMLFMPNPDHYEWLFAEHTREEWNQGSASALWDLETGQVLYADGIHTEASLRAEGKPLREWLGIK